MHWLVPLLPQIEQADPKFRLRVNTTHTGEDWLSLPHDAAIRRGFSAPLAMLRSCCFQEEWPVSARPVCSVDLKIVAFPRDLSLSERYPQMEDHTNAAPAPDLRDPCTLWMRGRPAATRLSALGPGRSRTAAKPISATATSADGSRPAAAARDRGLGAGPLALGRPRVCLDQRSLRRALGGAALGSRTMELGRA
jgi:DNA-binding transcriptional LysR family regulator